jgi:hypothetical protein
MFEKGKPFIINATGSKVKNAFEKLDGENIVKAFLGENLVRVNLVQDFDTDSTPLSRRSLYRRVARKTILYANIHYDGTTDSVIEKRIDEMFQHITFQYKHLNFKIVSTDFEAADFLALNE